MAQYGRCLCLLMLLAFAVPAWAALAAPAARTPAAIAQDPALAEAEINGLLQNAASAPARKDLGHLLAMVDDHTEVQVRGMGLDRRTVGRNKLRAVYGPELASAQSPGVNFRDVRVRAEGGRARLEAMLVAYAVPELLGGLDLGPLQGQRVPVPGRLSADLVKQGRRWVFQRMLFLFPGGAR